MKSYFICFLIAVSLLVHNVVLGQAPACFTLDYPKGCLPHTVTVDGSCASGYTSIGYDFINAGTYPTTPTTHTYSGTGNFRIIQFITTSGGNKYDTAFANVITATKPVITVKTCSGLRVDVTINDAVYDYYTIDYGDGSPLKSPVAPLTTDTKIYSGAGTRTIIVTGYFSSSNLN